MGLRETLNENPAITTIATIVILVVAMCFIGWQVSDGQSAASDRGAGGQTSQSTSVPSR